MLSERVQQVAPSATLEITAKAKAMKAQGIDIVSLGAGEPDFDTPEHVKNALYEAVEEGFIYYTPTPGILELKQAIAKKLSKDNKISYSPDNEVIVTPGAKQALYEAILAITNPGDEILIPDPWWVSYKPMVQLAEGTPIFVPTYEKDGFQLSKEAIEKKLSEKTKALILNSPCNPTGAVLGKYTLKEIAEFCIEHDLIVISDEIYEKIIYEGSHCSIASMKGMKERTITINGFSKAYSMTGWRLGYAAGPEDVIKAMTRIQAHSVSNATSFVQKAGVVALEGSQDRVEEMTKEFKKRRDVVMQMLDEIEGISCMKPKGSFYAFPNLSKYEEDSFKLSKYFLEKAKVAVIPGGAFGDCGEGYIRISYATSMENIEKGIERIGRGLERYKK